MLPKVQHDEPVAMLVPECLSQAPSHHDVVRVAWLWARAAEDSDAQAAAVGTTAEITTEPFIAAVGANTSTQAQNQGV